MRDFIIYDNIDNDLVGVSILPHMFPVNNSLSFSRARGGAVGTLYNNLQFSLKFIIENFNICCFILHSFN